MMQKILCPTDLSENSLDSVAYALQLAKENGAQLIVFHATSFPSFIYYPCELEPFYQWQELVSKSKVERILADAENKVKNFVCARFGGESDGVVWNPEWHWAGHRKRSSPQRFRRRSTSLSWLDARERRSPGSSHPAFRRRCAGALPVRFSRSMQLSSRVRLAAGDYPC
jgi:Universal stress protein family